MNNSFPQFLIRFVLPSRVKLGKLRHQRNVQQRQTSTGNADVHKSVCVHESVCVCVCGGGGGGGVRVCVCVCVCMCDGSLHVGQLRRFFQRLFCK